MACLPGMGARMRTSGDGHGVGDVLVQAGDPGDLHAGAELELVAGDGRADDHADEAGLHAVLGEGGLERAARAPRPAPGRPPGAPSARAAWAAGASTRPASAAGPTAMASCSTSVGASVGRRHVDVELVGVGRRRAPWARPTHRPRPPRRPAARRRPSRRGDRRRCRPARGAWPRPSCVAAGPPCPRPRGPGRRS